MRQGLRHVLSCLRLLAIGAAASALLVLVAAPLSQLALAQESGRTGQELRDLLNQPLGRNPFRRAEPRVSKPPPAVRRKVAKSRPSAKRLAAPEPEAVEKNPDARVVLVVGDFLAAALAEGLAAAFAQSPTVRVVDRSKGSSGFVRDDHYDWQSEIGRLIAAEKPAAVVAMIGANDRQPIGGGEGKLLPGSGAWLAEYARRAGGFTQAARTSGAPLLWIGLPPTRSGGAAILALNDVFRSAAEASGGAFVDVWDGFVDQNGAFVMSGPDVNGQKARLRLSDGVSFSRAGKRKLAFYSEKPLNKILDGGQPGRAVPGSVAAPIYGPPFAPATPPVIDRTPPIGLTDPDLDGGLELLGGAIVPKPEAARTAAEKLLVEGLAPPAQPGRADDFSGAAGAATATPDASAPDRTTAIRP